MMLLFFVAVILSSCSALLAQDAAGSHSVWDGVYTADQAKRGQPLYATHCASCHGEMLAGDGEMTPPLAGSEFLNNWDGLRMDALYTLIQNYMPQDAPGTLNRQATADIVAYLLSVNQFPAGASELPSDLKILTRIRFLATRPAPAKRAARGSGGDSAQKSSV